MDADWPPMALEWPARQPDPPRACPHYCQIQNTRPQLTYAPVQQQLAPRGENPREIRNKAEKQRRDKLKQSIAELESVVPPVVAASRKIDKTGVLRLTAHYLRAHQYVFGDSLGQSNQSVSSSTALAFLNFMNGFLITTTYKGIIVVVSQNVQQYLGRSELDLLGQNLLTITHEDDHRMLCEQLRPPSSFLGPNGELLVPDEPDGRRKVADALAKEKRTFIVRLKRLSQRSEPSRYVTCHVEGSLRKADRACRENTRCCQMVRRARARGDNPCSSGNDVVFIGLVRPTAETFMSESEMECYRMEYRTRHSIDGEIIQCEAKISLITGYMTHEVNGVNAMNFMHRDDVRWVIIALREMYDQRRVFGESCYRLVAKNGQFIYLKTRGRLEIDSGTNAVNSFVCTNTVVDETEGMHLIGLMKKRFMMVSSNDDPLDELQHSNHDSLLPLEDPRRLEKVILHLVTNLPTPYSGDDSPRSSSPDDSCTAPKLTIIPPKKERVISAIEKIYDVIKPLSREPTPSVKECDNQPPSFYGMNNDISLIDATPRLPMLQDVPEPVESDTIEDIVTERSDDAGYQNLATFEESFLKKRLVSAKQFNKISDQVLAAVQLDGQENATGLCSQAIKRPLDRESAMACKRKICDSAPKIFLPRMPSEGIFENFLDDNGIDSQLDSALNILNSIDNRAESAGVLPEILLESEFQELFGDMVSDQIEESTLRDESPSI